MAVQETSCHLCEKAKASLELYGYAICDTCKKKLGLFSDDTIQKHIDAFKSSEKAESYAEEIQNRLRAMQKGFIKGEIKLLHILERVKQLGGES